MRINIESSTGFVKETYRKMGERLDLIRKCLDRPLTFAEKIMFGHLDDPASAELSPGESYIKLRPDRVAMQDATAQMAILQFMQSGLDSVAVPSTVHCDHLIRAQTGADEDIVRAKEENREVYDFLKAASQKYGIGFWQPGSGIIHQIVLENYAFPGLLMIGTDSHTPNAGGLGAFAAGVGGADATDVMAGLPWEVLQPKLTGVKLTGALTGWAAPKDVILFLAGLLTVKGGTNRVVEYFGSGVNSISCTGKATITNMGAELGATCSIFPYDSRMDTYLRATERSGQADIIKDYKHLFTADPEVEKNPERCYDEIVEINLSELEPHIVGPHTPDLARPVSGFAKEVKEKQYPRLTAALLGSCTNSSYEDITRAADVAKQALTHGAKARIPFFVTPGSERVRATVIRDGQLEALEALGGVVLANACGPCIGQWKRLDVPEGESNSIINSFNRNFPRRNDGSPETRSFIAGPEVVVAYALAGSFDINPLTDAIPAGDSGKKFRLSPPAKAPEVPEKGFVNKDRGYVAPAEDGSDITIDIDPGSERLQLLEPFAAWDGNDFEKLPLLIKAKGKCTTDHISPAGAWLRFRGHLDNISDNMLNGAVNAFSGETGQGLNLETGSRQPANELARYYKKRGLRWVIVGDENYGEGSSREHAAMSPRLLGCAAVIVRSFARIHESNLKKQGILALTFSNAADYERVREEDRISIDGLKDLAPGRSLAVTLHHKDGSSETITVDHTLNKQQIEWFKAGSAINTIKRMVM